MLLAFNKPYGVLSRFTPEPGSRWRTLAEFGFPPGVYPLGRLDADSEGLLLLSDEPAMNARLLDPKHSHEREYLAQVDGAPDDAALVRLATGVVLDGRRTQPCAVSRLDLAPELPPRDPPIRFRRSIPVSWLSLELTEGKNRQVRRMTAAVGHPTLRLVRVRIGLWRLSFAEVPPGRWIVLRAGDVAAVFR